MKDMNTRTGRVFGSGFMLATFLMATFAAFSQEADDDLADIEPGVDTSSAVFDEEPAVDTSSAPVAEQTGIRRNRPMIASSADMQRPATSRLSNRCGRSDR